MKFLLHENVGQATIHRIGDYLRSHGTGHHWFERYRGRIFIIVADARDQALLRSHFQDHLEGGYDLDDETCGRAASNPANCLDADPSSDCETSAGSSRAPAPVRAARGPGP